MSMKVITGVALALATTLASPAFAQSARVHQWDAYQAYGQAVPNHRAYGFRSPRNVYNTNGRYVGTDPDPNVRDMIARDRNEQDGYGF
jgi:hypothetical protein